MPAPDIKKLKLLQEGAATSDWHLLYIETWE